MRVLRHQTTYLQPAEASEHHLDTSLEDKLGKLIQRRGAPSLEPVLKMSLTNLI